MPTDPVKREVRAHGFEPELEREIEAPDGDGSILELAVLRAASQGLDSVRSSAMELRIRPRSVRDLSRCVRILESLHRTDGYPVSWPEDPAKWLSPSGTLAAWVAEVDDRIAGHVALRGATADAGAGAWSAATGLPPNRLASITRLFVAGRERGAGIGGALLEAASVEAATRGLRPVLDVTDKDRDAIRLYERRGWRRVHSEPWAVAPETLLHYYIAPPARSSRAASPAA